MELRLCTLSDELRTHANRRAGSVGGVGADRCGRQSIRSCFWSLVSPPAAMHNDDSNRHELCADHHLSEADVRTGVRLRRNPSFLAVACHMPPDVQSAAACSTFHFPAPLAIGERSSSLQRLSHQNVSARWPLSLFVEAAADREASAVAACEWKCVHICLGIADYKPRWSPGRLLLNTISRSGARARKELKFTSRRIYHNCQ